MKRICGMMTDVKGWSEPLGMQNDNESTAATGSVAEDVFDNEFAKWIASEETQRRFHCGAFSEEQIAYSAARWARNFTLGKQ